MAHSSRATSVSPRRLTTCSMIFLFGATHLLLTGYVRFCRFTHNLGVCDAEAEAE